MNFIRILYLLTLITHQVNGFSQMQTNICCKKYTNVKINRCLHLKSTNNDDDEDKSNRFDIIEGIGGFMGYPKERKWKGFRIACYSIFAGSILRSSVVDLGNYIDNKIHKDSFNEFSNVALVVGNEYSGNKNEEIEVGNVKILDEPYLCESIKYI